MNFLWHYFRVLCFFSFVGYVAWYYLIENRREVVNLSVNFNDLGIDAKVAEES